MVDGLKSEKKTIKNGERIKAAINTILSLVIAFWNKEPLLIPKR